MRLRRQDGFSLIELLIVVAIILVLSAIAIPNLLRSRISANEASAVSSIRAIANAQVTYAATYPNLGFADNLTKLRIPAPGDPVTPAEAGMLDWVLGCAAQPCQKGGYNFAIAAVAGNPVNAFTSTGVPRVVGQTGHRGFCGDQLNRLRYDPAGGVACTIDLQ
jgi:type IV pilus assembly protein PilA